jgi:hypothetical protein
MQVFEFDAQARRKAAEHTEKQAAREQPVFIRGNRCAIVDVVGSASDR